MYQDVATVLVVVSALDMVVAVLLFVMLVGTQRVITKMKKWQAYLLFLGFPLLVLILAIVGTSLKDLGPVPDLVVLLLIFNGFLQMCSYRSVLDEERLRKDVEESRLKAKAFDSEPYIP